MDIDFDLNSIGYNKIYTGAFLVDRPSGSRDYLLLHFLTPAEMKLNGKNLLIKKGGCILYTPGYRQWYTSVDSRFANSYIHFDCEKAGAFIEKYEIPVNCVFYLRDDAFIEVFMKDMEREFFQKDHYWRDIINGLFLQLFSRFGRSFAIDRAYHLNPSKMEMLLKFQSVRIMILSKVEHSWTLKEMAELANICESRFCIYYKQFFNISPRTELINARIDKAKYLLENNAYKVSEIAELAGYSNVYHFIRQFKVVTGYTPTEYHTKNIKQQ